jgi:[NiFe] hydrogenase assembly HybE family chaperone
MLPAGPLQADQASWIDGLVACYAETARTRMAGLPVCHPGLDVAAVGFQAWSDCDEDDQASQDGAKGLLGVLLTPWFMNLVWKADAPSSPWATLPVGVSRELSLGAQRMNFIGAHELALGAFASCSLISPMFQFADQAAAVATAEAVVATLAGEAQAAHAARLVQAGQATQAGQAAHQTASQPDMPTRRGFLFGLGAPATRPTP